MPDQQIVIHWFRRDLRLDDNTALSAAHSSGKVLPIFIFDTNILDALNQKNDSRVQFIYETLSHLKEKIASQGGRLLILFGEPEEVWRDLIQKHRIAAVHTNEDYEPYARQRDERIAQMLQAAGISFQAHKDHVIFARNEVTKDDGLPYTIYTPYSKKWRSTLRQEHLTPRNTPPNWAECADEASPSLAQLGFVPGPYAIPPAAFPEDIIRHYHETRDFPAVRGTSRLSVHLRFGTISIRQLLKQAMSWNEKYLNELIWRDFYQMILWHFPHVVTRSFKPAYDHIEWSNNEQQFQAWCEGKTGFPIVDAGMRELNATGFMHNRVRMITASFLTKDLLIDWRWGEAYFAEKLLDYELASNNGGWQWAAGSGCDAAPYFRVFNPTEQAKKFDPQGIYIRQWIPEIDELTYPLPMVDHSFARKRALEVYKRGLEKK
jgi:deoxyribodipyrimidine photo-lyase